MLAPIVLISALGFNAAPNTKLLALRGGAIGTDALIDAYSALNILTGTSAWVAPKTNLAMYGASDTKDVDVFFMRSVAALQIALGAALIAGKADFNKAALMFVYGHAIQVFAAWPIGEKLNVPGGGLIGSAVMLVALGELTRLGVLSPSQLWNVAIFFYVGVSVAETFMQKATLDAFGITGTTALTKFLFNSYSAVKFQLGLFLLVSKVTGKQGLGLLAALGVGILNCVKAILSARETGFSKSGPLAWIGVQTVIGMLAYMSASA